MSGPQALKLSELPGNVPRHSSEKQLSVYRIRCDLGTTQQKRVQERA